MNQKPKQNSKPDWRDALRSAYGIPENKPSKQTSAADKLKAVEQKTNIPEFLENKAYLYEFLAGYKQNSGIYINNFFRKRDFKTYCEDKFHSFDFDISGILPNVFNNFEFSMNMVRYLNELEHHQVAYFPITVNLLRRLIAIYETMNTLTPLKEDIVLYRGCSTIKRNGVNGLVSTTTNRKIAEQFSRGTILKIHVPAGTKYINTKSIRPLEQQSKDKENEIILPPCRYTILNEKTVPSGNEPNNHKGITKLIEISVEPLDLLEEFLEVMQNPPYEYDHMVRSHQELEFEEAKMFLEEYILTKKSKANNLL